MRRLVRRPLAVMAAAILALALAPRARAQTIVVSPGAGGLTAAPNGFVTVPVVADLTGSGGAALGSLTARLRWRPGAVRYVSASLGTAGQPALNPDSANGELRFAVANAAGLTGTPVLVNATFQALGAPGDTMTFLLTVEEATRAGTFADLLPITTATSAPFCISSGRYGDLNRNDTLNSFDALLIVTHAVGLSIAPNTPLNGDVDGDGAVTTRDALIVLSAVVGLPTPGFRVGQLNSGSCVVRRPATVAISPAGAVLAAGDQVPLAAIVRDSVGAVVGAQQVAWVSRDPFVATVDAAGRLTAVGLGATRVVAVAAPGVMDSVTVTVGTLRHVWYVNPVAAAANPVELGSPALPFSRIQQAVDAAAAGDTVRIAVASYSAGARIHKPLVVLGDSNAGGVPRITATAGPAIRVDSIFLGRVHLSRLRLADAAGGLDARAVATLDLDRIIVESSTSFGVYLHVVGLANLTDVAVDGAVGFGIAADTVVRLSLMRSLVRNVTSVNPQQPFGVTLLARLDTLRADSVSWIGGIAIALTGETSLRNAEVGWNAGPLLALRSLRSITLDSVAAVTGHDYSVDSTLAAVTLQAPVVVMRTVLVDSVVGRGLHVLDAVTATLRNVVVRTFSDAGTQPRAAGFERVLDLHVAQSSFTGGTVESFTNGAAVRVDTTVFSDAPLFVDSADTFTMAGGSATGSDSVLVGILNTVSASITGHAARCNNLGTGLWLQGDGFALARDSVSNCSVGLLLDDRATSTIRFGYFQQNGAGIRIVGQGDSVDIDSTVVVDNSVGVTVASSLARTTGSFNFIARNGVGLSTIGQLQMDSSRIEGNTFGALQGGGSAQLQDNWWGDAAGPTCASGCPGVTGDSVSLGVGYAPFLTTPPVTPAGTPPPPDGSVRASPAPARLRITGAPGRMMQAPSRARPGRRP